MFARVSVVRRGGERRFALGTPIELTPEWDQQSATALTPTGGMISKAISAAEATRSSLAFIHTHPLDKRVPRLSRIDVETSTRLGAAIEELLAGPFVSLVVSPGGWTGAYYEDGELVDFERMLFSGPGGLSLVTSGRGSVVDEDVDDRQTRAIGRRENELLRRLRIGVVGVGGVGSPLAETLVRMGVGSITLVDEDRLEPSNMRRVFGVTADDSRRGRTKASAVRRGLERLGLGSEIFDVVGDVRDHDVQAPLLACDVLFGATDTHSSRAVLTELAMRAHLPLIDTGVRVGTRRGGRLDALLFERRVQVPGGPCLWCWNRLDAQRIRVELMTDLEREGMLAEGYVTGEFGEPVPSVAALTVAAAGASAVGLLGLITGSLERSRLGTSLELLRLEGFPFGREAPDPDCICARWRPR